jgi:hypothetical protein
MMLKRKPNLQIFDWYIKRRDDEMFNGYTGQLCSVKRTQRELGPGEVADGQQRE